MTAVPVRSIEDDNIVLYERRRNIGDVHRGGIGQTYSNRSVAFYG